MIKVILADDHAVLLTTIQRFLARKDGIEVLAVAGDGEQALSLIKTHDPDILVTDIAMPKLDGIEVARRVSTEGLRTKVLILSLFTDVHLVRSALNNGSSGFVAKVNMAEHLETAIKQVCSGSLYLCPLIEKLLSA